MSVDNICHLRIGCPWTPDSCIIWWNRKEYDDIAKCMGLEPKNYKNKIAIFKALGAELPYYLDNNPDIKKELKEMMINNPQHYLYDLAFT